MYAFERAPTSVDKPELFALQIEHRLLDIPPGTILFSSSSRHVDIQSSIYYELIIMNLYLLSLYLLIVLLILPEHPRCNLGLLGPLMSSVSSVTLRNFKRGPA